MAGKQRHFARHDAQAWPTAHGGTDAEAFQRIGNAAARVDIDDGTILMPEHQQWRLGIGAGGVHGDGDARQWSGGDAAMAIEGAVLLAIHGFFYPDKIVLVNNIRVK
jgi:hypothetical protein